MDNIKQFNDTIQTHLDDANARGTAGLRAATKDLWKEVHKRSPVDTGWFVGNWQIGVNEVNLDVTENKKPKPYPNPKIKAGDTVFISNSIPYARFLEAGWSKKQAPLGIIGPSLRAVQNKVLRRSYARAAPIKGLRSLFGGGSGIGGAFSAVARFVRRFTSE